MRRALLAISLTISLSGCSRGPELSLCARVDHTGRCVTPAGGIVAGVGYRVLIADDAPLAEGWTLTLRPPSGASAELPLELEQGASQATPWIFFEREGVHRLELSRGGQTVRRLDLDVTSRAWRRPAE